MIKRKPLIALLVLLVLGIVVTVAAILLRPPDRYHTPERRAWKTAAIEAVRTRVANTDWIASEIREYRKAKDRGRVGTGDWVRPDVLILRDGSWIVYRQQCHKKEPRVYDIFIGRASNGKWYYSTFHFCVDMCSMAQEEPADSLDAFIITYALVEFDGRSDQALKKTWPTD